MSAYLITGVSGTGKTTLASKLRRSGKIVYDIDSDEGLCHWRNKKTGVEAQYHVGVGKNWLDQHEWVCDEDRLKQILSQHSEVVVVGIASNIRNIIINFDKAILLHCNKETFLERINTRTDDHDFAKDESEQQYILSWYEGFEKEMKDLGAIPVSAEGSIENVYSRVVKHLNEGE